MKAMTRYSVCLLSTLVLLVSATLARAELPAPLLLDAGLIRGLQEGDLSVYRGIPYAAPPVGENRWRDPLPVVTWAGVRNATEFSPRCVQGGFAPGSTQPLTSEDCLYLNVWTPARSDTDLLPVMVWVHGGGFFTGAGSADIYEGARLAEKGAVVVTLNYRLGTFGFFTHPELTAESPHDRSGNYAMMDMLAALQWVQNNIEAFGGNPQNVTVFGESAGGNAVANLVASPLSEGLFRRAILQSGGWMGMGITPQPSLSEAEATGLEQARDFGADSLTELRQVSAREIFENFPTGGSIVVDGYFLPEDASLIFAAGKQQQVDVMAGSNRDEAVFFGPGTEEEEQFIIDAENKYGDMTEDYLSLYPAGSDSQANQSYQHSFNDELAWQMRRFARYQQAIGRNAYVYFFTRVPPGQETRGATHVAELAYVFNQYHQNANWTDTDRALGDTMAQYWVNFATSGDPNQVGLPSWPVYTGHSAGKVQVLGDTIHNERDMVPDRSELDFFDRAYERHLQQLME